MQQAATRSPSLSGEPSGALRTVPATSLPGTNGSGGLIWYSPRVWSTSGNDTPAAWTSTTTPLPGVSGCEGSGSGRSVSDRADSGPVRSTICRARMARQRISGGQIAPEMHDRVGAPRAPRLRVRRAADARERVADAGVAREEDVRVAQRAHDDVAGGPLPDSWDRHELLARFVRIRAGVEDQLAGGGEARDLDQSTGTAAWHRKRLGVDPGQDVRAGKAAGERVAIRARRAIRRGWRLAILRNRRAVLLRKPPEDRPRARDRHLLPDDRPHGELEAVDRAGHSQPRMRSHERAEQRVRAEMCRDRDGIRIEVEQAAAPGDGGGQVADVVEAKLAPEGACLGWQGGEGAAKIG